MAPLLGYIKLIDASRPETMDKYTVEVLAHQKIIFTTTDVLRWVLVTGQVF